AITALYVQFGASLAFFEKASFFFILVCLSYIDIDSFSLPFPLLLTLFLVGAFFTISYALYPEFYVAINEPYGLLKFMVINRKGGFSLSDRLWGAGAGLLLLSGINVVATYVFRMTKRLSPQQWAMGWGDPLLVMGIGLFIGISHLVLLLF